MKHTQTTIYNNRPVVIAMGWDQPLQGYFMIIYPEEGDGSCSVNPDANPDTGMIYSNLDDKELPFPRLTQDLEHYKEVLRNMGIQQPTDLIARVLCD